MKVFQPYKDIIASALNNDRANLFEKSLNESYRNTKMFSLNDYEKSKLSLTKPQDLELMAQQMGVKVFTNQQVGHHPDFVHLKGTKNREYHNIVSVFIDVKGSTNLYKKYDNDTVFIITDTIQLLGITLCKIFGGFIHRLQGDGLFVYFGGKGINRKSAINQALIATSLFNSFLENDLKQLFEAHGIERIKTRVGMDFGDDKDVLWAMAGTGDTSEVTTVSLHTSLAPKMQHYAQSNGTVIGKNVIDSGEINKELYWSVEEERYIYRDQEKSFYYGQYHFNWLKFLKQFNSIVTSQFDGNIEIKPSLPNYLDGLSSSSIKPIAEINRPWLKRE